jgi:hypothetical protein
MQITFDMPHVFSPRATPEENAYALRALLDCLISLNIAFLRTKRAPPLYQSGVRYGRTTIWDTIPALYGRRYGDCKSLSAALIAEYRILGMKAEPVFRFMPRNDGSGALDFHILVQLGDGSFEDPSKKLGMGQDENAHFGAGRVRR